MSTTESAAHQPGESFESPGQTSFHQERLAEREEILRHKWFESERAGQDVGFDKALLSWVVNHRSSWLRHRWLRRS